MIRYIYQSIIGAGLILLVVVPLLILFGGASINNDKTGKIYSCEWRVK